jgi:hypothetical protein
MDCRNGGTKARILTECESTAAAKRQNAGTALHARGFAPSISLSQESFARRQHCRWLSTATTPNGSAGAAAPPGSVGDTARELDASRIPRKVFIKRQGGADWAEVTAHDGISVAGLKEQIKAKLELKESLDALTLHVTKDKAGNDLGAALDSTDSIAEVLSTAQLPADKKVRIVVKVVTAASAAESGTSNDAAPRS